MAGLPKVAEIVENLSKVQAGASEPEQAKVQGVDNQEPTEEKVQQGNEPLAAAEDGQAKSPENRVPYDRFKEVNEKLKDAHEVIAGFERRFQTLEAASATGSDQTEATQAEPSLSDKINTLIEEGEIGEGAAALMQELAGKVGKPSNEKFIAELQLERATKALGQQIDGAMKGIKVHDERGAKMYLAQTIQNDPKADLSSAVEAWTQWEGEYEKKVLERHGVKQDAKAEEPGSTAPKRPGGGSGGGGVSPSQGKSEDDAPMSLKQVRSRLQKARNIR
tara:strand:+ start:6209 stop:7039 length:831 start_codon:yes stop_codon:yes gene_type:complete